MKTKNPTRKQLIKTLFELEKALMIALRQGSKADSRLEKAKQNFIDKHGLAAFNKYLNSRMRF